MFTLVIHGGEIISSNADKEPEIPVIWYNPSRVQVEMTEGGSPIATILAVGMARDCLAGLVIIGGAMVLLQRRNRNLYLLHNANRYRSLCQV